MVSDVCINTEALSDVSLFRGLTGADLTRIVQAATVCHLKPSTVLFRDGAAATALYVVAEGRFKVTQVTVGGQELLLHFVGPGQMMGGTALLGNASYRVTAAAVEPSCVLSWSSTSMSQFLVRHPRLAQNALRLMAERIVELQDRCRELSTELVDRRVARALLRLAQQTGKKVEGGILLGVQLSRQDLAEMTGTTLYTASRILSRWTQDGLIKAGRQKVLLCKPHALVCIAEDLLSPGTPAKTPPTEYTELA